MTDDYDELAAVYDRLNPKEEIFKQQPFYQMLKDRASISTALDCACGTGWHIALFHELGIQASGSDVSPAMIREAVRNLAGTPTSLRVADFRRLPETWTGATFDLVTCLTTSLPYMLTDEDVVAALNSMYDVLNTGGLLVIDNGITDALLTTKPPLLVGRVRRDDAFYFFLDYPNERRITFNILYVKKTDDGFSHLFKATTYNALRQSALEQAFKQTRFAHVDYFGDYELAPYGETSARLLVLATK
jgi:ubiquinone/menaquinone biosynthesis C-methylase UbiE